MFNHRSEAEELVTKVEVRSGKETVMITRLELAALQDAPVMGLEIPIALDYRGL